MPDDVLARMLTETITTAILFYLLRAEQRRVDKLIDIVTTRSIEGLSEADGAG